MPSLRTETALRYAKIWAIMGISEKTRSRRSPTVFLYPFHTTVNVQDINRTFPVAIDLGCWDGQFASGLRGRGGVKQIYECDSSCPLSPSSSF